MANDIEKIIETIDIPEMEYDATQPKHKSISYEVPEVVLPKTKAQEYEEAKDRLTSKTVPVSKTYERRTHDGRTHETGEHGRKTRTDARPARVKTVELDSAASAAIGAASNATRSLERKSVAALKKEIEHNKLVDSPKWVGSEIELIPFAWRHPLVEVKKPSKYYKAVVRSEKSGDTLSAPRTDGR
ncbi:MAG: hypothetical protein J1G38_03375 [Clostridiales bacterium]|nr:hypothetical protein [Clostridiales bacterium]